MSAPYGLTSTSFPADQKRVDLSKIPKEEYSVQAQIALAILSGLADELRTRGYEVNSPGLAKKAAIASFSCKSFRMIVDLFLTVNERQNGIVECKLEPLGWRRTWKVPPYEEIWREWVQMRTLIEEYLTNTLHVEPLRWERARAYRFPTGSPL